MKAVVIVVEGLGASMVGAYGSATFSTPAINRLAANGLLLDQCFLDSFSLEEQLQSLWTARHANGAKESGWNFWRALADRNVPAQLITDCEKVAEIATQFGCPEVALVDVPAVDQAAENSDECILMHVFATAIDILSNPDTDGVVWIHSRGLRHPWDAPLYIREAMIDPEDPAPPSETQLPEMSVDEDTDPDLIVGWGQVAAAQVAVLDEALDALEMALIDRESMDSWTWLLLSLGGIPLGEHGALGIAQQLGYNEEIAIPVIIRPAQPLPIGMRRSELCQLPDVLPTLLSAMEFGADFPDSVWGRSLWDLQPPARSIAWKSEFTTAWFASDTMTWIRTPAWSAMRIHADDVMHLYVKPDDRWEVNDVAGLREDVLQELWTLLPAIEQATGSGQRHQLPQFDEFLTSMIR